MAKKFDFKRIGMKVAGVGAGAIAARFADKPLVNMNPKLRAGLKILVGAVGPELAPKNALICDIGCGVLAVGAVDMFESFTAPKVSGDDDEYTITGNDEDYQIKDDSDISGDLDNAVSGNLDNAVSGMDEETGY